jgi:hypothetical protein
VPSATARGSNAALIQGARNRLKRRSAGTADCLHDRQQPLDFTPDSDPKSGNPTCAS